MKKAEGTNVTDSIAATAALSSTGLTADIKAETGSSAKKETVTEFDLEKSDRVLFIRLRARPLLRRLGRADEFRGS